MKPPAVVEHHRLVDSPEREAKVLQTRVHAIDMAGCVVRIVDWARRGESRVVVTTNVHAAVVADRDPSFRDAVNTADLSTPDGWPIAAGLRRAGFGDQARVSGPDLMLAVLSAAAAHGLPVYLYGGHPDTLEALVARLRVLHPDLRIAGAESPPFRRLTAEEDEDAVSRINESGARILFVGLGCPKQERWVAMHRGRVRCVMLGVGAAFDFHAGTLARAPVWMQARGLEWLHRLAQEPRRLASRYFFTNVWFLVRMAWLRASGPFRGDAAGPVRTPASVHHAETPRR